MTRIFTPLAKLLLRLGISPDAVTIAGTLVVVTTALWAFPTGNLLLGTLIITVFVLTDSLDGVMARQAGRSGPWGAFLDSTMDRFGDGAIFAGLVPTMLLNLILTFPVYALARRLLRPREWAPREVRLLG